MAFPVAGLKLNCWVDGSVFTVKIAREENVSALKKAIKEEKPHTFQHVEADTLDIWKVRAQVLLGRHC